MKNIIYEKQIIPKTSLQKALDKEYILNSYIDKRTDSIVVHRSFPRVLAGRRVRLVLVEKEKKPHGNK